MDRRQQLMGLIGPGDGIDDVSIAEVLLRNSTYLIRTSSGSRVRKRYSGSGAAASQCREVAAYWNLAGVLMAGGQPIMPELLDLGGDYIVLDAPVRSRVVSDDGGASVGLLTGWTSAFGEALSALHSVDAGSTKIEASERPWIMEPLDFRFYLTLSSASRDLLQLLTSRESGWRSVSTDQTWRETAIIHGDIKWSNLLRIPGDSGAQVWLIDWELCGIGDPAWDVGSFLSEFLLEWATSIPILPGEPADRYAHLAGRPIESMQPSIRAFWVTYVQRRGADIDCCDEFLIASTRYAGARLVQSAFERAQTMATPGAQTLLLAQLGINVMAGPEVAAEQLLGITPDRR